MKYFELEFYDINDINWTVIAKIWQDKLINDIEFQWQENTWCSSINVRTKFIELYNEIWISEWNIAKVRIYDNKNNVNWDIIYVWYIYSAETQRTVTKWDRYDVLELKISHCVSLTKRITDNLWAISRTLADHVQVLFDTFDADYPWLLSIWTIDNYEDSSNNEISFAMNLWRITVFDYLQKLAENTSFIFFLSPTWEINFRKRADITPEEFIINEWTMIQKVTDTINSFDIVNRIVLRVGYVFNTNVIWKFYTYSNNSSIIEYWVSEQFIDKVDDLIYANETLADEWSQVFADNFFEANDIISRNIKIDVNDTFFIYQLKVGDYISIINTDLSITREQVTKINYSPGISTITIWKVFSVWKAILWQ